MQIQIHPDAATLGKSAALMGAAAIRTSLWRRGKANIILATGASQFEMLKELVAAADLDWSRVSCFHLDEYAGMSTEHPASFRRYLKERFVDELPQSPKSFEYIDAEHDCAAECERLGALISKLQIDVAFIGIGENGHLAFNDPPADFETPDPYLVVDLDDACRRQQLGEGWFDTLDDVPRQAISMSVRQILKSRMIVCSVPDERKAEAVKNAVEGPVSPECPASILREHQNTMLLLDQASASQLTRA